MQAESAGRGAAQQAATATSANDIARHRTAALHTRRYYFLSSIILNIYYRVKMLHQHEFIYIYSTHKFKR